MEAPILLHSDVRRRAATLVENADTHGRSDRYLDRIGEPRDRKSDQHPSDDCTNFAHPRPTHWSRLPLLIQTALARPGAEHQGSAGARNGDRLPASLCCARSAATASSAARAKRPMFASTRTAVGRSALSPTQFESRRRTIDAV